MHSQDVVSLSIAVAEELGLDARGRRDTEFVALLHDVGKIRIPNEIINKPGPLTPEERLIVETHTVIGEGMLDRVGGVLGNVGHLVRSCHERYGGGGYPDGLVGDQIPLVARIVSLLRRLQRDHDRSALPRGAVRRGGLAETGAAPGRSSTRTWSRLSPASLPDPLARAPATSGVPQASWK